MSAAHEALWRAIDAYAVACGGDVSPARTPSSLRALLVWAIEQAAQRWVDAETRAAAHRLAASPRTSEARPWAAYCQWCAMGQDCPKHPSDDEGQRMNEAPKCPDCGGDEHEYITCTAAKNIREGWPEAPRTTEAVTPELTAYLPPQDTEREMWLLTPLGSMGRNLIGVAQYEELRQLARKLAQRAAQRPDYARNPSDDVLEARVRLLDDVCKWLALRSDWVAAADLLHEHRNEFLLAPRPETAVTSPEKKDQGR